MTMTNIEIRVPETIRQYVLEGMTEKVRNAMLLYPSIANDTISHGKAAELLGLSKIELIQIYGKLGLPYLDMSDKEFEEEAKTVNMLEQAAMRRVSRLLKSDSARGEPFLSHNGLDFFGTACHNQNEKH